MKSAQRPLAAVLQPFVDAHTLAGAVVLVADRKGILDLDAVGYADVAARRPMEPDALFWIASQTKSFTATAFMTLVDEGKAKLSDRVECYLPEFKNLRVAVPHGKGGILLKKPTRAVTLRHLLSHTSGLPFKSAIEEPVRDRIPLDINVRSYAMTPLEFEPGSRYLYSNAGINTVGRIVEVVSGLPYETFLRQRLLAPLGLTDTVFRPDAGQLRRLAKAYKPDAAKTGLEETAHAQYSQPYSDPGRQAVPGGGLFSTAADVAAFCRLLLNGGRVLSASAIRQMTRKQTGPAVKTRYGLGWNLHGDGTFGHGGAWSTAMTVDPARGRVFVFMVQHAGFPGNGNEAPAAFRAAALARFG